MSGGAEDANSTGTGRSRTVTVFATLAVLGLVLDLWTKHAAFDPGFRPDPPKPIAGGWAMFQLTTSFNEGALFGVGQGWTWLFALLSLVAVAGVFFWMFWLGGRSSAWLTVALGLILAGTLGNLYDRAGLHGEIYPDGSIRAGEQRYAVRDFLLFTFGDPETPMPMRYHYPVFNFADVFLVTGAVMLVLKSFQDEGPETEEPESEADDIEEFDVATRPAAIPETEPPGPPGSPPGATTS